MKNAKIQTSVSGYILKIGILAILIIVNNVAYTQSPTQIWAKRAGGTELDKVHYLATDNFGNTLITGEFEGTANFGTITLSSNGSSDIFITNTYGCICALISMMSG